MRTFAIQLLIIQKANSYTPLVEMQDLKLWVRKKENNIVRKGKKKTRIDKIKVSLILH